MQEYTYKSDDITVILAEDGSRIEITKEGKRILSTDLPPGILIPKIFENCQDKQKEIKEVYFNETKELKETITDKLNPKDLDRIVETLTTTTPTIQITEDKLLNQIITEAYEKIDKKENRKRQIEIISDTIIKYLKVVNVEYPDGEIEVRLLSDNILKPSKHIIKKIVYHTLKEKANIERVNETIHRLEIKTKHTVPRGKLNPQRYLPLQNMVLDLKTLESLTYNEAANKNIFFTSILNIPLNIETLYKIEEDQLQPQDISPIMDKLLGRFYDHENREKIELGLGWILTPPMETKKPILLVTGDPDTGKSTLLNIISLVLGEQATTTPLHMIEERFGLATLVNSRVNMSSEKPPMRINSELLKRIVGGETLTVEEKYGHPYQARIYAMLIHFQNALPKFKEVDDALIGRIKLIWTRNPLSEDEKDPLFLEKIKEHKEEILAYLIYCRVKLENNKYIIPEDPEEVRNALIEARSNVYQFLKDSEFIEFDETAETKGTDFYDAYTEYCTQEGLHIVGRPTFYNDIISTGKVAKKTKHNATYFKGIRLLKPEKPNKKSKSPDLTDYPGNPGVTETQLKELSKFIENMYKLDNNNKGTLYTVIQGYAETELNMTPEKIDKALKHLIESGKVEKEKTRDGTYYKPRK